MTKQENISESSWSSTSRDLASIIVDNSLSFEKYIENKNENIRLKKKSNIQNAFDLNVKFRFWSTSYKNVLNY